MRIPGWVFITLADPFASPSTVEPVKAQVQDSASPWPPAALRRDLRVCERSNPGDAGEIEFGVRVSPAGAVVLARALRATLPAALLNCTLQRLRVWSFPPSEAGAAFRFSMTLGEMQSRPGQHPEPGVDTSTLKAAIKGRTSALQRCYNETLPHNPDAQGKLSLDLAVARTGEVTSVVIAEAADTIPTSMVTCCRERVLSWTLSRTTLPMKANISFSVVFHSPRTDSHQHGSKGRNASTSLGAIQSETTGLSNHWLAAGFPVRW
ncbi:MAG: AgmX/PglI C-terminal domain-containing protein [Nannocystaceae bacterium]|nr:AgmX/PglI C-terminal domain-containing protein [Nannocystaceae bacterium]